MLSSMWSGAGPNGGHHREVLRLAVPAFVTLVAEPLFLLADSVVVGHLGTVPLAALGVASAALGTAASVFVFLAYGTTGAVARRLGAGDERGALGIGIDGLWLALVLGLAAGIALLLLAGDVASWLGADAAVVGPATTYLRISALSLPAMLLNLASTGVLRGLQDTRTPLVVALVGFPANAALNVALVYGAGLGIAGSAWGTALAQLGMAAALMTVVVRLARRDGASLRAHPARLLGAARDGFPLLLRTLSLRGVLLLTTWVAAGMGVVSLAAYQVSSTVWITLTFMLDALAIAGQALTGRYLGAGDVDNARAATRLMLWWGVGGGAVCAVVLLALHRLLPLAFTTDQQVRAALAGALIVVAIGQPLSGWVFVLDGVLIGAGDGRWLAGMQLATLLVYLPIALPSARTPAKSRPCGGASRSGCWSAARPWAGGPAETPGWSPAPRTPRDADAPCRPVIGARFGPDHRAGGSKPGAGEHQAGVRRGAASAGDDLEGHGGLDTLVQVHRELVAAD